VFRGPGSLRRPVRTASATVLRIQSVSIGAADRAAALLAERFPVLDEGWAVSVALYTDRKVLVRFDDGSIGEVQILTSAVKDAKESAHRLYVQQRELYSESPESKRLLDEQRQLYAEAVRRSSGLSGIVETSAYGNLLANFSGERRAAVWEMSAADTPSSSSQTPLRRAKYRPSTSRTAGRPSQFDHLATSGIADTSTSNIGSGGKELRTKIRLASRFNEQQARVRADLERIGRDVFGWGFRIELAESITPPDGGAATGAFDPANRLAYIALRVGQPEAMQNTLYHEGLHYLRAAGTFAGRDGQPTAGWRTLQNMAPHRREQYRIDERYGEKSHRASIRLQAGPPIAVHCASA